MGDRSLHCSNKNFCSFFVWTSFAPVTLTLTRWPSYTNVTVLPGDTANVQIWTLYVNAFESYRLSDIQTDRKVTRGHFRSRYKDDGHIIWSGVVENPLLHANLIVLSFIWTGVMGNRNLHCENMHYGRFRLVWTFKTKLFDSVQYNANHVLHQLLPPEKDIHYNLRQRSHSLTLPSEDNNLIRKNFLHRILFRDIY